MESALRRDKTRAAQLSRRATIGVLTALPKELAAMRTMVNRPVRWTAAGRGSGREYWLGEIRSYTGRNHVVAIALLPDMGTNLAAITANNLLHHFSKVEHLIMCGIAGGVPSPGEVEHDVRLGDIVVSNRNGVVQYDLVKERPDGTKEHRQPPRPPGAELLNAVRQLETEVLLGNRPWLKWISRGDRIKTASRPADNLNSNGESIEYPPDAYRESGLPRVFSGAIAAANNLLKNATYRDYLGKVFKVKAVEMESSGIADAAWIDARAGYLVVRGICDYCDEQKGDLWQGYAAVAAAAYVRTLIESMAPIAVYSDTPPDRPRKVATRKARRPTDGTREARLPDNRRPAIATEGQELAPLVVGSIPTDISHFTGRAATLESMREFYRRPGSGVCVLFGLGGCGKSATLKRFADIEQVLQPQTSPDRPAAVFSWSFAQDDNLDRFFVTLSRYLDSIFIPEDRMSSTTLDIPHLALPDKISRCNRRIILLVDGLERVVAETSVRSGQSLAGSVSVPSMRALLQRAAENDCGQLRIFVTTRVRIPELNTNAPAVEYHDLNRMTSDDAVRLLRACGVRGVQELIEQAASDYHYHAYSLFLLGKALAAAFGGDVRRRDRIEGQSDAIESPIGVLLGWYESYLDNKDISVLRTLSLFRGDVSVEIVMRLLTSVPGALTTDPGMTARGFFRAIGRLRRSGLVFSREEQIAPGDSYSLHPIVREFYYNQLINPADLHERALKILDAELPEQPPEDAVSISKLLELVYHSIRAGHIGVAWRIYRDRMGGYPRIGYSLADHPTGTQAVYLFIDEARLDDYELSTKDLFDLYVDGSLYLKNEGRLQDSEELLSLAEVRLGSRPCEDDRFASMLLVRSGIQLVRGNTTGSLATVQRAETAFEHCRSTLTENVSQRVRKEVLSRRASALAVRGAVDAYPVFAAAAAIPDVAGVVPHDYLPIRFAWFLARLSMHDAARAIIEVSTGPLEEVDASMLSQRLFVIAALNEFHAGEPKAAQKWIDRLTTWSSKADLQMFILSWLVQTTSRLAVGNWREAQEWAERGARHAADNGFALEFHDFQILAAEACLRMGEFEAAVGCTDAVLQGRMREYLCPMRPATSDEMEYFWAYSSAYQLRISATQKMGLVVDEDLLMLDSACRRRREALNESAAEHRFQ
jgi:nucleoside phosphorylase